MQDNKQLDEKELELALEQAKATRLELEQKAAEEQQRAEQARREREQMDIDKALRQAVTLTGVRFYPPFDELKMILGTRWKFGVTHDGNLEARDRQGKIVNFEKAIVDYALEKPFLADGRTLKPHTTQQDQLSKADFTTAAEKAAWISRHSLSEWEALPLRPTPKVNPKTMTAADWAKLPNKVKAELIAKYSVDFVSDVLRRK